jgi:hypothetical protein
MMIFTLEVEAPKVEDMTTRDHVCRRRCREHRGKPLIERVEAVLQLASRSLSAAANIAQVMTTPPWITRTNNRQRTCFWVTEKGGVSCKCLAQIRWPGRHPLPEEQRLESI